VERFAAVRNLLCALSMQHLIYRLHYRFSQETEEAQTACPA
jgi:hypothetical protein